MNAKVFGATVLRLRKEKGYTQAELAEKLHISDKTVSKWENGLGYPDIVQLPALANVFGVTTDYLLFEDNKGITLAGSMIVDVVKTIDEYPQSGMLANIRSAKQSVGGCVPNTGIDLAVLDSTLPVSVLGRIGDDENGRFLLSKLQANGINVSGVKVSANEQTSFCDVMSMPTGERTFFSYRGANAQFSAEDVDVSALTCKIFHIGYILLMDKFDAPDEKYGTVMAKVLSAVQKRGVKTSIDMVSASNVAEYAIVKPALPYSDYVIINEIECCGIWGLNARNDDGTLNEENLRLAMQKMMEAGVGEKVVVHSKEAGYCLNKNDEFFKVGSLVIPKEKIKGSVGAGDAFCAGCLYALYHDYPEEEMLKFASMTAGCSLFAENSVDGMRSKAEVEKIMSAFARRDI